jgi:hypothetical protein
LIGNWRIARYQRRSTPVTKASFSRSGGDVGGVDPWADPSASLRDLFFLAPAPAFAPLDGEGFILQVHRVFTRIRSGASLVMSSGDACGFANYSAAIEARVGGWLDLLQWLLLWGMKTLRVLASIYNLPAALQRPDG